MILGKVYVDKVRGVEDLQRSLRGFPVSDTVILKPNWYSPHAANYTDAHALALLMDAVTCGLIEADLDKVGHIAEGEKLFGPYSRASYRRAVEERRRLIPF